MTCYEHEMLCLALDAEIRTLDPLTRIDRGDLSDALTAHGIRSFRMLGEGQLAAIAVTFIRLPMAA